MNSRGVKNENCKLSYVFQSDSTRIYFGRGKESLKTSIDIMEEGERIYIEKMPEWFGDDFYFINIEKN